MEDHWQPRVQRVPRLVWPVPVDPTGASGPTRGQAAGPHWRRSGRNLYVPSGVSLAVPEQRIVEAAAAAGHRGVVTGWAALRLQGAAFFDGLAPDGRTRLPVEVIADGARMTSRPGLVVRRATAATAETSVRHGIRCAVAPRAVLDEIRTLGEVREAVVVLDMAFTAEITSPRRVRDYLARHPGTRGVRLAAEALALADECSESPQESRFRLLWQIDAGWGRPLVNRAVLDVDGRFLGRPDLLDPVRGVVGEFQGADHRGRDRHRRDVRREDLFRRAGLEYVEVVGSDLLEPALVVDRMHAAGDRAGRVPRRWRLGPARPPLDDVLDLIEAKDAMAAPE